MISSPKYLVSLALVTKLSLILNLGSELWRRSTANISYNEDGTKQAFGEYNQGEKVGTWTFYNTATTNKVAFENSRIASVSTITKGYLATK
jgi:hypothetical protein